MAHPRRPVPNSCRCAALQSYDCTLRPANKNRRPRPIFGPAPYAYYPTIFPTVHGHMGLPALLFLQPVSVVSRATSVNSFVLCCSLPCGRWRFHITFQAPRPPASPEHRAHPPTRCELEVADRDQLADLSPPNIDLTSGSRCCLPWRMSSTAQTCPTSSPPTLIGSLTYWPGSLMASATSPFHSSAVL